MHGPRREVLTGAGLVMVLVVLPLVTPAFPGPAADLPRVRANDNLRPAGRLRGDTLTLHLVVRMAAWRPEADAGPEARVAAFAEEGGLPEIPGPLIRVRAGTVIAATVRNALADSTLWIHGLATHPAALADSVAIRPGESRAVTFLAGTPGTYFYRAVPGRYDPAKDDEREQLAGALVVDPVDGSPPDRVFVLNIWGESPDSTTYRNALTINGRSWPYTERIDAAVGDTVRWRVINASGRSHPMHLHGFYFRVDARGNGFTDTAYAPADRPMVVTSDMVPFATMTAAWVPAREGNWLFHCHIGFHVVPAVRLDSPRGTSHDRMAHDPRVHMAGLVLGIRVRAPPEWRDPPRGAARQMRLFVQEGHRRGRAARAMGFVLQRSAAPPAPDSLEMPGSILVMTRGEPTDVTVVNRLPEPAAIHWHGIELESYSDGVAGWSGLGDRLAPSIEPGDSFVARLTLPTAGTFIYHTHMNDIEQLSSGLYGALLVLEPGQPYDPATDHVFVAGSDGEEVPPQVLINGDSLPRVLRLAAGRVHRFRFINITLAPRLRVSLWRGADPVAWRPLAKDGAAIPPARNGLRPSGAQLATGETADFTWEAVPGEYELRFGARDVPPLVWRLVVR